MTPESIAALARADVARALQEDLGSGDLTAALVPEGRRCRARILAREAAVICGAPWAEAALRALDPTVSLTWLVAGFVVWAAGMRGKRVVIGSRTEDMAMDVLERCQYIRRSVASVFPMPLVKESTRRMEFATAGRATGNRCAAFSLKNFHIL